MADDIVEHLAAVDKLEDDVVVVWLGNNLAGATDVRMEENHGQSGLSDGANLL